MTQPNPTQNERVLDLDDVLRLAVALARTRLDDTEPQPGDLFVEDSWMRSPDPDAIGWLIGHGEAPYGVDDPLDGSVPMREVWDVAPLNPSAKTQYVAEDGRAYQRWENARFWKVPDHVLKRMGYGGSRAARRCGHAHAMECTCAMTEASMWGCPVHGVDAPEL